MDALIWGAFFGKVHQVHVVVMCSVSFLLNHDHHVRQLNVLLGNIEQGVRSRGGKSTYLTGVRGYVCFLNVPELCPYRSNSCLLLADIDPFPFLGRKTFRNGKGNYH